eukprot:Gregarina_sp_Poly_1__10935@NODE_859_length_5945_cov_189_366621_g621_i0_p3_GENE_NODE_859_length_5945_cov_189_366621_g621_i0NODE_859_length_5945_cov_189_366621_g621_i0_p3_ORF_typecomplete_len178_score25_77_NODE_859_length_5945_cov_189_366621_g621_i0108641
MLPSMQRETGPVFSEISSDEYYVEGDSDHSESESSDRRGSVPYRYHQTIKPPEMINGRREMNQRMRVRKEAVLTPAEGLDLYNSRKARLHVWSTEAVPTRPLVSVRRPGGGRSDSDYFSSEDASDSEDLSRLAAVSFAKRLPYFSATHESVTNATSSSRPSRRRKASSSSSPLSSSD